MGRRGAIVGTPDGPAALLSTTGGTQVAFLQVDRPSAMDDAYVDAKNTHAVHEAVLAFADSTPATCPADPLLKQDHLRALALVALTSAGPGKGRARVDLSIVIDAATLADGEHERR